MHVTKIVRFDWLAVFESFCWYKVKLARNRAAFYSAKVSGTRFLGVCHPLYSNSVLLSQLFTGTWREYNLRHKKTLLLLMLSVHGV